MTLRIGIVSTAPVTTGGAATYDRAIQNALSKLGETSAIELVRFANVATSDSVIDSTSHIVKYEKHPHAPGRLQSLLKRPKVSRKPVTPSLQQALSREKISLAWFLAPNRVISSVVSTPFVMTVWDLAHREVQGFPEFAEDRRWAHRESMYGDNLGRAFHVLTDSKRTGKSLERLYGVYPENWSPIGLPLPPREHADFGIANDCKLPYFYYPASFWPHKNHRVVIDALLETSARDTGLVFSGHDEGHLETLRKYVDQLGLEDRVRFVGRVSDAEVQGLIEKSIAVLMPSLLGPTNYPPLEALRSNVPCIVSDVHHYDFVPESGMVVVDRDNPSKWAEAFENMRRAGRVVVRPDSFVPPDPQVQIERVVEKFERVLKARILA